MGRKKKEHYFDERVDQAIHTYNQEEDSQIRSFIYEKHIHKPMRKLIENVIHKYQFRNTDMEYVPMANTIHEIEVQMMEKLHLFDPSRGKGFSYFNWSIFTSLIILTRDVTKRIQSRGEYDEVDNSDIVYDRYTINDYDKNESRKDYYTDSFLDYVESNVGKYFTTRSERVIAESIILIIKNRLVIDIFDKKSLYMYVRNIHKCSQQKYSEVFNVIKDMYWEFKELDENNDEFSFEFDENNQVKQYG